MIPACTCAGPPAPSSFLHLTALSQHFLPVGSPLYSHTDHTEKHAHQTMDKLPAPAHISQGFTA